MRHAVVATVRGSFGSYEGVPVLDAAAPATSSTTVSVDAVSLTTGQEQRDGHVRSPDVLDVATFPKITLMSTNVVIDDDDGTLHGNLETCGSATDPVGNTRAGFEGTTSIRRKDYGMEFNAALDAGVLVGVKVKITLDSSAVRAA